MNRYLGIDLGGTSIKYGVVQEGKIIFKGEIATEVDKGTGQVIEKFVEIIESTKEVYGIKAVGMGVPGIVDISQKIVYECKNLFWENLQLGIILEEKTAVPVILDNDANLSTLAEEEYGFLKGVANGILLTLGTGVGGGVIINGQLYRGNNGLGFEVGHMRIASEGLLCNCGREDCFETYTSATGLIKHYNITYNQNISEAKEIFDKFSVGEKFAKETIEWYCDHFSDGIVNLINLFDPEIIVLAGGVSKAFDIFEKPLNKAIDKKLFTKILDHAEILPSKLGNDSGILGSAMLAKQYFSRK
ncbi:MAG: ROK family protein [Clostridiales bacterium]|nr:ROK family protein [Clostridiales bacterium]